MDDDLRERLEAMQITLHRRAIELAHPRQNNDLGEVFQGLALIMETLASLDREQRRIAAKLSHQ